MPAPPEQDAISSVRRGEILHSAEFILSSSKGSVQNDILMAMLVKLNRYPAFPLLVLVASACYSCRVVRLLPFVRVSWFATDEAPGTLLIRFRGLFLLL